MREQHDPDTDPVTGVFYNKLGLTDAGALTEAEYRASTIRLHELALRPLQGNFDLSHLQRIHAFMLQDVYPWAGQLRSVETSSRAPFAKPEFIIPAAQAVFSEVARRGHFVGLDLDTFVDRAAWLYGEINAIHPFREGNGRANCQMLSQLAHEAGFDIRWAGVTQAELDAAAAHAMGNTSDRLREILVRVTGDVPPGRSQAPAIIRRPTSSQGGRSR